MSKYKVYHNPRCSKSRLALEFLTDKNIEFDVVEYLNEVPTADQMKDVLNKLGIDAEDLIRKGEADYKENFKGKNLSENEWIDAMIKFPKLIERPIVISGNRAVIARPSEKIDELK